MNAAATVLVLTGAGDGTADAVVEQLHKRDTAVVRMDIGDFPQRLRLAAALTESRWQGLLECDDDAVALADIRSIYYRRPTRFDFDPRMSPPDAMFAAAEARGGLGGVLAALDVLWVNDPSLAARAEYKPLQLRVAADVGLLVPPTLVTNDHAAAVAFATVHTPVVAKTLSSVVLGDDTGAPLITYTTRVNVADIDPADFAATANLLQRWVAKAMDCRVTMVGERPYAVAVRCDSVAGHVDWRADYPALTYEPVGVPDHIIAGMIHYLERFGLRVAAFDFGIDHNGVWWFYEANPAGQWLWIEDATELDISGGLADLLTVGKP